MADSTMTDVSTKEALQAYAHIKKKHIKVLSALAMR
jgi:hypothetical protein